MQSGVDGGVFLKSARLLVRSPAILVPGLVFGSVGALVSGIIGPPDALDSNVLVRIVQAVVQVIATILAITFTTGMADAAWRSDRARFSDGARAFGRDAGHVFIAMIVLFIAGAIAAALAPFTAGISLFVYVLLFVYTMASAVVGENPGFIAARESVEILIARPGPTLLVVAGVTIVAVVMSVVAAALSATPYVGPVVATLALQAVIAYVTLVIVGEYRFITGL